MASTSTNLLRRAEISCVNGDQTVDVIYLCRTARGEIDEECNVTEDRCAKLLDWEFDNDSDDALYLKDCGNMLFALKDYEAAVEWYHRALEKLEFPKLSIGCTVITAPLPSSSSSSSSSSGGDTTHRSFRIGTVSDCDDSSSVITKCDIMYDDLNYDGDGHGDGDDEEVDMEASRVTIIHPDRSKQTIQASLYSNLAKSSFFLHRFGWAVRNSSIAILIQTQESIHGDEKRKKNVCDMYFVRIRAFLSSGRPRLAGKDVKTLGKFDETRAKILTKEIEQFKTKRQVSNRKLAKDVAAWVDQAMQINSQIMSEQRIEGGYSSDNDNDINSDCDSDGAERKTSNAAEGRTWGQWFSGTIYESK